MPPVERCERHAGRDRIRKPGEVSCCGRLLEAVMNAETWSYDVTRIGQSATVALSGEIEMSVSGDVLRVITAELRRAGTTTVLVDLSAVSFLGSAGMQALVEARKLAVGQDQRFAVIGAKGIPRQVLDVTGLLAYLQETRPPAGADD
jgi:anti-sigma B factor antagonist